MDTTKQASRSATAESEELGHFWNTSKKLTVNKSHGIFVQICKGWKT